MKPEVKVGILFTLVILLAVAAALYLSEYTSKVGTYELVLHFKDVKGLAVHADVRMAGVKIGSVASITLSPSPDYPAKPVRVLITVDRNTKFFSTDTWVVDQAGVLGDLFVSVQRPTEEQLAATGLTRGTDLKAGQNLEGGEMTGFAALGDQAGVLVNNANKALEQIVATYANPQMKQDIQLLMGTMKGAAGQFNVIAAGAKQLVGSLNRMITANEGAVNQLVGDLTVTIKQVRQGVEQVTTILDGVTKGPIPGNLTIMVANIRAATEDMRATAAAARGLLANPENQKRIDQLAKNALEASENLKAISASVKSMTADPQMQADFRETLTNLHQVSEDLKAMSEASRTVFANKQNLEAIGTSIQNLKQISSQGVEITHKANDTLDRVQSTMTLLGGVGKGFKPDVTTARFRLETANHGRLRGDAAVDLQYGSNPHAFWRLGVRNVGNNGGLDAQRALDMGPRAYGRAGIFGGRLGLGLNYQASPDFGVELEGYNPTHPQLDLRLSYQIAPGMQITGGLYKALDENNPFIGVERDIQFGPSHPR